MLYCVIVNLAAASALIRGMLTVSAERRSTITQICSHAWINEGFTKSCLEEAEYLASLTPVRLDILLSLAPPANKEEMVVEEHDESKVRDTLCMK
jgi:hypothetical protein